MNRDQLWTRSDISYGKALAYQRITLELQRMQVMEPGAAVLLGALVSQIGDWWDEAKKQQSEADGQLWADLDSLTAQAK